MTKKSMFILFVGIAVLPMAAIADGSGAYISGDLGQSHFSGVAAQANTEASNMALLGMPFTDTYTDNDTGYRLSIGYQFDRYWAMEASYVNFGQADININSTSPAMSSDTKLKAHGWVIAATGSAPISDTWAVFVRLGAIDGHVEKDVITTGFDTPTIESSTSSTDWRATYGAGLSWSFAPNWSARLGWDQYRHLGNSSMGENNVNLASIGIVYLF
jgi:OmpA-OmpF porin, OOP family